MPATIWVCIVPGPEGDKRIRAWTADNERAEAFRKEGLEMQEFGAVAQASQVDLTASQKQTLARIANARAAGIKLHQFWLDFEASLSVPSANKKTEAPCGRRDGTCQCQQAAECIHDR